MKEAEFVRLSSEICGYGLKGLRFRFEGVEETVRARVEAGWTYCGYVPEVTRGVGDVETILLVFQREA